MVYGIDLGKKLLSVPGLPVVEPEIKVYPQFLFPDAALREFTEHGNHLATLAIGVAGQNLNQVSESSRSITIDHARACRMRAPAGRRRRPPPPSDYQHSAGARQVAPHRRVLADRKSVVYAKRVSRG